MFTLSTLLPILLTAGGYAARHFEIGSKLLHFFGLGAPNPLNPPPGGAGPVNIANRPILSDAVNAAIKQAVADVTGGHIASLKDEIKAVIKTGVDAAVADLKAKTQAGQ